MLIPKHPEAKLCMELDQAVEKANLVWPTGFDKAYHKGEDDALSISDKEILIEWGGFVGDEICPAPDLAELHSLVNFQTTGGSIHIEDQMYEHTLTAEDMMREGGFLHAEEYLSRSVVAAYANMLLWLLQNHPDQVRTHWERLKRKALLAVPGEIERKLNVALREKIALQDRQEEMERPHTTTVFKSDGPGITHVPDMPVNDGPIELHFHGDAKEQLQALIDMRPNCDKCQGTGEIPLPGVPIDDGVKMGCYHCNGTGKAKEREDAG